MSQPTRSLGHPPGRGTSGRRGRALRPVLQRGNLDVVLVPPARPNEQASRKQEEVYFVVRGRGVLVKYGQWDPFGPGDFLFVAATDLRFEDLNDDLLVWRVFFVAKDGEIPAEAGHGHELLR